MSAIVEIKKAYDCLSNFRNNRNEEYKKFIDIFFPILYKKENRCCLEISVGKQISKTSFQSALSMITTNFIVKIGRWNDEPQFIIYDVLYHNTITILNLSLIKNLHIESNEHGNINFYDINFNYNNEIDYQLHIEITE